MCKGEIATNVLGVCNTKKGFRIRPPGWKGSTADSRILRDALARKKQTPSPKGYPNLRDFSPHIEARGNTCKSGVGRSAILHGKSYYPLKVQCRTILACCLLHNLIKREMTNYEEIDDVDKGDSTYAMTTTRTQGFPDVSYMASETSSGIIRDPDAIDLKGSQKMRKRERERERFQTSKRVRRFSSPSTIRSLPSISVVRSSHSLAAPRCRMATSSRAPKHVWTNEDGDTLVENVGASDTGFRWNDDTKCIISEKEVFESWVRSHPAVNRLFNKPFSYYDELAYMFRRDRTMSNFAEIFADIGSNEPTGYKGFDMPNGNKEFPFMYSQGIDMSQEDVSPSQPVRTSDCKVGLSGSKRNRESQ
ncbi:retrotransposon protein [Cucumis melo var. makuwa]|uniref:Retrotransposon protein n=1 Tax=Cucumis melo var. makuwa TaxID=1194695 RepID=A0A5A7T5K2_CUCMM|nr:retrotransposon protein [Cucumis melo var. makuwa]TYJ95812.1 retrotransposon protein [Cucumis melo var. makuwa]